MNTTIGSNTPNYGAMSLTDSTAVRDSAKIALTPVEVPSQGYSKEDTVVNTSDMKDGGIEPLALVDSDGKELPKDTQIARLVDDNHKPIIGPKNIEVYILVDAKGSPLKGDDGQAVLTDKEGKPLPTTANQMKAWMRKPSVKRVTDGLMNKYFVTSTMKTGVNLLVEGKTLTIPFTGGKVIGWGAEKAVINALSKTVPEMVAQNVSKEAGKKIVSRFLTKTTLNIDKKVITASVEASLKTAEKKVPKIMQESIELAVTTGTKTALKNAGKTVSKAVVTQAGKEAILKTASDAAIKTTATTSAKIGSKLSVIIPAVGAAIGVGITAWDTKVAIQKQSNPHISGTSKALSWATVGLDVVATGCSGIGAAAAAGVVTSPVTVVTTVVGAVATGLSIGTSVLSDILQ